MEDGYCSHPPFLKGCDIMLNPVTSLFQTKNLLYSGADNWSLHLLNNGVIELEGVNFFGEYGVLKQSIKTYSLDTRGITFELATGSLVRLEYRFMNKEVKYKTSWERGIKVALECWLLGKFYDALSIAINDGVDTDKWLKQYGNTQSNAKFLNGVLEGYKTYKEYTSYMMNR